MPSDLIFIAGYLALWLPLGLLAWAVLAVPRRGAGTVPALPAALGGAVLGGVLTPLVAVPAAWGLLVSLPVAFIFALAAAAVALKFASTGGNRGP